MSEWQPIETAPRDGSWVLGFVPSLRIPVQIIYYTDTEHREHGRVTYSKQGWHITGIVSLLSEEPHPTHWMPFPDPPLVAQYEN